MMKLLASGKINNRLLCEIATHPDFQRLMVDTEICVDRIAAMRVHDMNVVLAEARKAVMEKHNPGENDLYMRTLELAQIDEDEYFNRVVHDDLDKIIADIRDAHKKDATTADSVNPSDTARQELEAAMSYEGSAEERQACLFCKQLGINYDRLSMDEFISLINILKKSSLLKGSPINAGRTTSGSNSLFPVPLSASTQLYEEKLHEGLKSTQLQFREVHSTKNCTFAILETVPKSFESIGKCTVAGESSRKSREKAHGRSLSQHIPKCFLGKRYGLL